MLFRTDSIYTQVAISVEKYRGYIEITITRCDSQKENHSRQLCKLHRVFFFGVIPVGCCIIVRYVICSWTVKRTKRGLCERWPEKFLLENFLPGNYGSQLSSRRSIWLSQTKEQMTFKVRVPGWFLFNSTSNVSPIEYCKKEKKRKDVRNNPQVCPRIFILMALLKNIASHRCLLSL